MRIMLVCMRYGYGDPARGDSYEYCNFYDSLVRMGHEVHLFDYMTELKNIGKPEMNRKMQDVAAEIRPDLAMFSLYTDQFDPEAVNRLRRYTKSLCIYYDDGWRGEYSRYWAQFFDYSTTPDFFGVEKYRRIGLTHAIHFPFGCNESLYHKMVVEKKYDVSFVGAWHPWREWLIRRLEKTGIKVTVVGHRWPRGAVSYPEMVKMFNESRINLNLSNSTSWDIRYLTSSWRGVMNRLRSPKTVEQLKARHFEISGTGAFQLSYYVEGLEKYYDIGTEIGIYADPDELVEKVRFYLADDELRERIARAGHERTLREHTFAARFDQVFRRMGLPASAPVAEKQSGKG